METTTTTTATALDLDTDLDSYNQPYIHLNGFLPNLTKSEGEMLRLKCNVAGTLPIDFRWYKNDAPLLRDKDRIIVKSRDYWSRLVIKPLQIMDSAFYRCEARNTAGMRNTTAKIMVTRNKNPRVGPVSTLIGIGGSNRNPDDDRSDRDDLEDDGPVLKPLTCQEYPFDACRQYLNGQKIYIHSKNIEDMKDIDRRLRAAFIVISNSSQVSDECKIYAARAACYHSYKICDTAALTSISVNPRNPAGNAGKGMPPIQRICKSDCDKLENEICPEEYKAARSQNLIGKGHDQILPNCRDLTDDSNKCLRVIHESPETSGSPCYVGNGEKYRGVSSTSKSGRRCQSWTEANRKHQTYPPTKYPELKFHNYCRNPGGKKPSPWCYTTDGREEYCDIPQCPPGSFRNLDTDRPNGDTKSGGSNNGIMGIPAEYTQYILLAAGILGVLFIVVLVVMACYCVRKSKRNRAVKNKKMNGTNGGHAVANGASTSLLSQAMLNGHTPHHHPMERDYYNGGLAGNGIRRPIANGQQMEMTSLLPPTAVMIPGAAPPPSSSTLADTLPEIPPMNIILRDMLGEGEYGIVYKAELIGYSTGTTTILGSDDGQPENEPLQVAVKILKDDSPRTRQSFESEVKTMARLRHPNIVELIGRSCMRTPPTSASSSNSASSIHPTRPCMIFEYMINGSLNEFLLLRSPYSQPANAENDQQILSDQSDFLNIATQIAAGMEYLASQHYVHRDLATRNCLMANRRTVKISDFGLTRDVYASDYYRQQSNTKLPIRWMPPEAIVYSHYSEASDVWSYGVTLWEIYSYGTQPYFGCPNPEVAKLIQTRHLLPCPENCPPRMYSLMVECWHETPCRRPRFSEIHSRLQTWSVVSSPAHSSAAQGMIFGNASNNNRLIHTGRVTSSSVHSDRSGENSSGTSSCRTRSNGGPVGSAGQIMSTNSIIALGAIPPAGTPSSRNSPYPMVVSPNQIIQNKHLTSSPQLPRTPLNVNGYALRSNGNSMKPYSGANDTDAS